MATNAEPVVTNLNVEGGQPEANVNKIRDILFGSQMREYDKRFSRLEERLTKQAEKLRDDTQNHINSLESFIKSELDSLNQRLKAEKTERSDSIRQVSRELEDSAKSLVKKIAQFDDATTQALTEIRKSILDQAKALTNEAEKRHRQLSDSLGLEISTLATEKTDRSTMADLLTEVALRLRNEFNLPKE